MKKKKRRYFVAASLLGIVLFLAGCGTKTPGQEDMIRDLADAGYGSVRIGYEDTNMEIDSLTIERENSNKSEVVAYCAVEMHNENVKATIYYELIYRHYDKGGWYLEDCAEYADRKYMPLSGVNVEEAIAVIRDEKFGDETEMVLTGEETMLEEGRAILHFDTTSTYETCVKKAVVTANFEFSDGTWNYIDLSEDQVEMDFSPLIGVIYTSDHVLHTEVRFLALDEENKTITLEYYVGDNFAWQTEKLFQQKTLRYVIVDDIMYIERFYDVCEYAHTSQITYYPIELWINAYHNKGAIHDDAWDNPSNNDPTFRGISGEMIDQYS